MEDQNIEDLIKKALEEAFRERGHANILVAGRTGVGKSTLINSVFQSNLAMPGQGRPVTKNTEKFEKEGFPLSIYDTRGLEMADFSKTLKELKDFIFSLNHDPDPKKHIHVAWVCIVEDLRRVEDAESNLVAMLAEFMPVVGVITKARSDNGFEAEVKRLLPQAKSIVRVRAISEEQDDGHILKPMNLAKLVNVTIDLFPEGQRRAFVAAQKADLELKKKHARLIVKAASASAFTIGATPIPFADAVLITPVQLAMIAGITSTYGLSLSTAFLSSIIASAIGGSAATLTGRAIVGGLLKLFPGVGSIAGGTISGTTAATITTAFGEAYIAALDQLFTLNDGEPPSAEQIVAAVRDRLP